MREMSRVKVTATVILLTVILLLILHYSSFYTFRRDHIVIRRDTSAIVVLDPLETYRNTFTKKQITHLVDLVTDAQLKGIPVIVTRWVRTKGSLKDIHDEIGHWSQFVSTSSEPLLKELSGIKWDLWLDTVYTDAFAPVYIEKQRTENVLREFVQRHGVQTLVIAGTWAEACVSQTSYTAAVLGMTPIIPHHAVGGYLRMTLKAMDTVRAHVVERVIII